MNVRRFMCILSSHNRTCGAAPHPPAKNKLSRVREKLPSFDGKVKWFWPPWGHLSNYEDPSSSQEPDGVEATAGELQTDHIALSLADRAVYCRLVHITRSCELPRAAPPLAVRKGFAFPEDDPPG